MFVLTANKDVRALIQYLCNTVNLTVYLISKNKDKLHLLVRFSPAPSNVLYSCIYRFR